MSGPLRAKVEYVVNLSFKLTKSTTHILRYVCTLRTAPVTGASLPSMSERAPSTCSCAIIRLDSKSEIRKPGPLRPLLSVQTDRKEMRSIPSVTVLSGTTACRGVKIARLPIPRFTRTLAESPKTLKNISTDAHILIWLRTYVLGLVSPTLAAASIKKWVRYA